MGFSTISEKIRRACLLALLGLCTISAPTMTAEAATMSLCPPPFVTPDKDQTSECGKVIWIYGRIEPGDYAQFKELLVRNAKELFIDQNALRAIAFVDVGGGDAREAVKIGAAIRTLGFTTATSYSSSEGENLYSLAGFTVSPSKSICRGGCILAWLGGLYRHGNATLILDGGLQEESNSQTSNQANDAPERYEIQGIVFSYLMAIGAPKDFFYKLATASSGESALSASYVQKELVHIPWLDRDHYCQGALANCFNTSEFAHREAILHFFKNELRFDLESKYGPFFRPPIQ